jgi:hypothetical protein
MICSVLRVDCVGIQSFGVAGVRVCCLCCRPWPPPRASFAVTMKEELVHDGNCDAKGSLLSFFFIKERSYTHILYHGIYNYILHIHIPPSNHENCEPKLIHFWLFQFQFLIFLKIFEVIQRDCVFGRESKLQGI